MKPTPSARLVATPTGRELVLTRTFHAPIDDVWASVTESERTALWFGPWSGTPGVGNTITITMVAEEDGPPSKATIDACEPPNRLGLSMIDEAAQWKLELRLAESGGITTLELVQLLAEDPADASDDHAGDVPIGDIGAGWEYYLDRLVAARENQPMPDFDAYYPAMKAYFEGLLAEFHA